MVELKGRIYEEDWDFENNVIIDYAVYDAGAIKTAEIDDEDVSYIDEEDYNYWMGIDSAYTALNPDTDLYDTIAAHVGFSDSDFYVDVANLIKLDIEESTSGWEIYEDVLDRLKEGRYDWVGEMHEDLHFAREVDAYVLFYQMFDGSDDLPLDEWELVNDAVNAGFNDLWDGTYEIYFKINGSHSFTYKKGDNFIDLVAKEAEILEESIMSSDDYKYYVDSVQDWAVVYYS